MIINYPSEIDQTAQFAFRNRNKQKFPFTVTVSAFRMQHGKINLVWENFPYHYDWYSLFPMGFILLILSFRKFNDLIR